MRIELIVGIVFLLVLSACSGQKSDAEMMKTSDEKETMMEHGLIGGDISKYYDWDKTKFDEAVNEGKTVFLDFSADWCAICKTEEVHLKAAFDVLDNPNVVGFKIPYKDGRTTAEHEALAQKYQIPYQHTKVVLKNGKVMIKSPEAWTAQKFLEEMNKIV